MLPLAASLCRTAQWLQVMGEGEELRRAVAWLAANATFDVDARVRLRGRDGCALCSWQAVAACLELAVRCGKSMLRLNMDKELIATCLLLPCRCTCLN